MRRKVRSKNLKLLLVLLLMIVTVGYATLTTNLTINGTSKINNSTWNVHFNNPSAATTGSVSIDSNDNTQYAARKDSATQVSYSVLLSEPGDFYEFTVEVENEGSIDAMIDEITSTIQIGSGTVQNITSQTLPAWLNYTVTYSDGIPIAPKQKLDHGTTENYKVRVEFKRDITNAQLEDAANKELHFVFGVEYTQKDDTAVAVAHPTSFTDDDWSTIVTAAQNGNTSAYTVGSTKSVTLSIDLDNDGTPEDHTYTLRVANNSTPDECKTTGFSQTACGFVLEFADIITEHIINPYNDATTNGDGNKGGWEHSKMRTYVNSDIYNALPSTLKNAIVNTTVVSGYGYNDSTNFTTTDKLYLLSPHEVWEDADGNTSKGIDCYDKSYSNTRQLDYYKAQNVTTSNYSGAIKQNSGSNSSWWLRSARSSYDFGFFCVSNTGYWVDYNSSSTTGVSPAFRLG